MHSHQNWTCGGWYYADADPLPAVKWKIYARPFIQINAEVGKQ
ncbi:hypothetical protein [Phormidium sp. CCY1219]|nr:hypothetical protein [Phormidium sp. CCY1219]